MLWFSVITSFIEMQTFCDMCGFHMDVAEYSSLLGCYDVVLGR
jgi:hypothetical protein